MVKNLVMRKIEKRIRKAGDERLFYIAEALKRGVTPLRHSRMERN